MTPSDMSYWIEEGSRIARSDFASFNEFLEASSFSSKNLHPTNEQENDKKCHFCRAKLKDNHKTIKVYDKPYKKITVCNNCENLYRILKREYEANNIEAINNIIWEIKRYGKSKN